MQEPWAPEHPVDAALAARLIGAARPDLAGRAVERVGAGWDNDVWRVGELAVLRYAADVGDGPLQREALRCLDFPLIGAD
ncbi:MAG: hypothetical protein KC620_24820 [Myxococcales bacterium]|nr:hypothetical protein [Myxococcales bacterium]